MRTFNLYLFTDDNNNEYCSNINPEWDDQNQCWDCLKDMDDDYLTFVVKLPKGTIFNITGYNLNPNSKLST